MMAILGIATDGRCHHQHPPSPFWAQPSAVVRPKPRELCRVSWAFPCTPSAWEMSKECLELYYSQVWVLRPYPITSACPPLWTPKPASFPANSDPLRHNPACSAPHASQTPFHHPSDPPDFCSDISPSCAFCSVSHWESTHYPQGSFLLLLLCPMKIAQAHVVKLLGI